MDTLTQQVGACVEKYMKDHGYNAPRMAELIGCHYQAINHIRKGENLPSQDILDRMIALGVKFPYIKGFGEKVTFSEVQEYCKRNKLTEQEFRQLVGIGTAAFYNLKDNPKALTVRTLYKIWKLIHEYDDGPKESSVNSETFTDQEVEESKAALLEQMAKKAEDSKVEDVVEDKTEEEKIKEIFAEEPCTLNYIPNEETTKQPESIEPTVEEEIRDDKFVTVRRLMEWAEKHGALDVPIIIYASRTGRQELADFGYNISCHDEAMLWVRGAENG